MRLAPTPSQTAGPFVEIGFSWEAGAGLVPAGAEGAFMLSGNVLDGDGRPVTDAVLEWWQADPAGRFLPDTAPGWTGFARTLTLDEGRYALTSVKPGRVLLPSGALEAPHLALSVFARGLLQRAVTYVYFEDEEEANAADPLLASLDAPVRERLLATQVTGGYCFDVVLQGKEETPFFVP